ncbi:hypothetical protein D3C72_1419920 [compost metagenome]
MTNCPVDSIGRRNISGTSVGLRILRLFAVNDMPMRTMKYHTIGKLADATAELARDSTKAIVKYEITWLCNRTAAATYATRPMAEIINQAVVSGTPPSKFSATPTNGKIAKPVPRKAVAAGRSRATDLYSIQPAP